MSPKREREDSDMEDGLLEDVADQSLLARHGPITLEVESQVHGSDACPVSTVMDLDLERLDSDDLFPTLRGLSTFGQDLMDDGCVLKKSAESSSSLDRTLDWDMENGLVSDHLPPSRKRLQASSTGSSLTPVSGDVSTLSALLSSPRKVDREAFKSEKQRTGIFIVQDGSEHNGPSQDVTICGENGDIRPCSPPQVGCSAFLMCDSSDSNDAGLPRSNGETPPLKSVSVSRLNPPPPYPSTGNGSWNHIDVGSKSSGSVVVVNHSDSVTSSRVHRPSGTGASTPTVLLSNGPRPSAASAECKLPTLR